MVYTQNDIPSLRKDFCYAVSVLFNEDDFLDFIENDEMNIKIVMSRREMYEIIEMLNKINRKLQKMQGVNDNGNPKK